MSNLIIQSYTGHFLELISVCSDAGGSINLKTASRENLKKLEIQSGEVVSETIKSIGAIGDLLWWSQTLEEPPNECTGQIGLLLRSLSDLLSKADLVNDNVYFQLNGRQK